MLNKKALAASVSAPPAEYVEDVFSTYLYSGTNASKTITNDIDLSGDGGAIWIKGRNFASNHWLTDTVRGNTKYIRPNLTGSELTYTDLVTSFNNNGFTLGTDSSGDVNSIDGNYCSWTFRKAPKFFDVVTYTGTGSNTLQVSHSLGSTPGMVIYKRTDSTSDWCCLNRANNGGYEGMYLNKTDSSLGNSGSAAGAGLFSTYVKPGEYWGSFANTNGATYVAYLFAHDAGGFGTAGTDNIISCGSFTSDGSGLATINLGYEPQYILLKRTDNVGDWILMDVMRGITAPPSSKQTFLEPNTSDAEATTDIYTAPTSTGMYFSGFANRTFIYMAIRRPMKTPTSGTEVFKPVTYTGTGSTRDITGVGFALDANIVMNRASRTYNLFSTRLQGLSADGTTTTKSLASNTTDAEISVANSINGNSSSAMDGYTLYGGYSQMNSSSTDYISYNLARRPGFFDVVCYTGTGTTQTLTHNLGAVPELIIVKNRNGTNPWVVGAQNLGKSAYLILNGTDAESAATDYWGTAWPTATTISYNNGGYGGNNFSGSTYVAYLFATVAGVSKVGSYTGNGSSQTINCGFTAGARFVLIKRTDSTGDWYVYDTARGIVSGNDPQLKLNTTGAEATGYDAIDPDNSGFIVNNDATNFPINVNNATYIYLAIA